MVSHSYPGSIAWGIFNLVNEAKTRSSHRLVRLLLTTLPRDSRWFHFSRDPEYVVVRDKTMPRYSTEHIKLTPGHRALFARYHATARQRGRCVWRVASKSEPNGVSVGRLTPLLEMIEESSASLFGPWAQIGSPRDIPDGQVPQTACDTMLEAGRAWVSYHRSGTHTTAPSPEGQSPACASMV